MTSSLAGRSMDKLHNLGWEVLKEDMLVWCVTHQPFHARQQPVPSSLPSRHYSTIWCTRSEPPTMQARRFASVSTLASATRGQSAILLTGAGSQAVVESTLPRPGNVLHQWPRDLHELHHSTSCSCSVAPVQALVLSLVADCVLNG
ncbi:hypothetical protein EMCRGX_G010225 [Ephydatia muelleri]